MLVACVVAIAHAASVSGAQSGHHAEKRLKAVVNYGDGDAEVSWYPIMAKKVFHPGPESEEDHAVRAKRKQVGCKMLWMFRSRSRPV